GNGLAILPTNNVKWLADEPGLRFGQHASIFSDKNLEFTADVDDPGSCSLEVWIEPTSPNYTTTVLAFSTKRNPLQFQLRQLENSLEVSSQVRDHAGKRQTESMLVERVFPFRKRERLLIAVSSGASGTAVYVNGKLRRSEAAFWMSRTDLSGRMV